MTVVLTVSAILFGVLAYLQAAGERFAGGGLSGDPGIVSYPGATPETMANNVATPLERQFMQIPGSGDGDLEQRRRAHQFRAAIRAFQEPGRGRDRRAVGHHPGHGQSCRWICRLRRRSPRPIPTISRFMYVGLDQRHGDRGAALRLRQYAGGRADQHSCRASARWLSSARNRPCASRPIPRRWPAAASPWTI